MARLAAATVAAALLLSACGDGFQPPAAVVNGRRISQAALETEIRRQNDPSFRPGAQGAAAEVTRKDLTRTALFFLIELQLAQQYADDHAITVTGADVERAMTALVAQLGGRAQFDQAVKAQGLTLAAVRLNLRRQVLFRQVENSVATTVGKLPTGATAAEKDQYFQKWFEQRFRASDIVVNPRFGRLNLRSASIAAIHSTA